MSNQQEVVASWAFKQEVVTVTTGPAVLVREFTGADRDAWEQGMTKVVDGKREADLSNQRAKLAALCVVDQETGDKVFPGADGVAILSRAPASWLQPVYQACLRVNGLDVTAAEDAEKN